MSFPSFIISLWAIRHGSFISPIFSKLQFPSSIALLNVSNRHQYYYFRNFSSVQNLTLYYAICIIISENSTIKNCLFDLHFFNFLKRIQITLIILVNNYHVSQIATLFQFNNSFIWSSFENNTKCQYHRFQHSREFDKTLYHQCHFAILPSS